MMLKTKMLCALALSLAGCSWCEKEKPEEPLAYYVVPYQEDRIVLEDLQTKVLVYCYNGETTTAEDCAVKYESGGYVRVEDIPRLPAEYDFLKSGTYPTRRWRNGEEVPRW